MKYQRKTNEFVDILKVHSYTSAESILDFAYGATLNGIVIKGVLIEKTSDKNYIYTFQTIKKTSIARIYKEDYVVKTDNNEIELWSKEDFVENFTTPFEYE